MKHPKMIVISLAALLFAESSSARDRLGDLAAGLAQAADQLVAEGYRGFANRSRGTRADVEALFFIQQFSASASLFRQLVADNRPDSELRDAAAILQDQVQGSTRFGFGRRNWRDMEATMGEIVRELGRSAPTAGQRGAGATGRMRWRGRIDNEIQIAVQGSTATARVLTGADVSNSFSDFTAPLPMLDVNVQVRKLKGRGSVEVIQQPSRLNGYTAVVRILDNKGGWDDYEFELVW